MTASERHTLEWAKRIAMVGGGALVGFRGFCLALSPWAGDNPFRDVTWKQLLAWAVDPAGSGKVVLAAIIGYGITYVISRKLSPIGVGLWAVLFGGYLAVIVTVDLVTRVDELGFLTGPVGAVLKLVALAVLLPMGIALAVQLTGLVSPKRDI